MQSGKSLEVLAKKFNLELKSLSQWLKANKLSLNIKKTELANNISLKSSKN